jgi:hypothetical protein
MGFETYTCHYIDSNFVMQSRVLTTKEFSGAHTGQALADLLHGVVNAWELVDKVTLITVDNAKNMECALDIAEIAQRKPCFAHTLNLASVKTFSVESEDWKSMLKVIRGVVTHFHKSNKANEILHTKQRLLETSERKLIMDCSTRWNSTYLMLKRFLKSFQLSSWQLSIQS